MADINFDIESPNITVDSPITVGLRGFADDIIGSIKTFTDKVREGDDEVMTLVFLSLSFVVAGVFVWRRL